jgi:hypothetical protein
VRGRYFVLLAALASAGCQEKLTAPADCPALCPGGSAEVFDEVISPIAGADSSFRGYVQPASAPALLVSNGLDGFETRGLMRFSRRSDTVTVRDTARTYTIDSVAFGLNLVARDTTLPGLSILLYRVPPSIDTTTTYAGVDPAFVPANLIRTIVVPDTLKRGAIRTVFSGADLNSVLIPSADSGVLALGIRIDAPSTTGIRLGSSASGTGGVFFTYATLNVPDTGTAKLRTFTLAATFNSFVTPPQVVPDTTLLVVGGEPSSRALLRFELPPHIRDSATIVRATLELTPVAPISGLPTDPARLQARAVLADLGAKSPVGATVGRSGLFPPPADTIEAGATTVNLEAVRLVEGWLSPTTRPSALVLSFAPDLEAASFSRPVFYSTKAADPAVRPRLRISYLRAFPFENP